MLTKVARLKGHTWAGAVIESASSRTTSLYGGICEALEPALLVLTASLAKFLTFSRMTAMPRSSLAFSSSTRSEYRGLNVNQRRDLPKKLSRQRENQ